MQNEIMIVRWIHRVHISEPARELWLSRQPPHCAFLQVHRASSVRNSGSTPQPPHDHSITTPAHQPRRSMILHAFLHQPIYHNPPSPPPHYPTYPAASAHKHRSSAPRNNLTGSQQQNQLLITASPFACLLRAPLHPTKLQRGIHRINQSTSAKTPTARPICESPHHQKSFSTCISTLTHPAS